MSPDAGTPGPFTLLQVPLGPSTFLFLKGTGLARAGRTRCVKLSVWGS